MSLENTFNTALLRHIRANGNPEADRILHVETVSNNCWGHDYGDSCCCDTGIKVQVYWRRAEDVGFFRDKTWLYEGDFHSLIRMLDRTEAGDE